ncbi:hypothetical protein ANN_22727 [Periplaneta americana]|uniref:Per a allergen n=1 Tax=Periplaneta americana TaxID=6978 RepID=A0ABQ8SJY3_PERAM|nr:hypothetical protein ANN_22727 [Periplaneta americana]
MAWNVGVKSVISIEPSVRWKFHDMMLTETFATEDIRIDDYYGVHILAKQGNRGRPEEVVVTSNFTYNP